MRTYVTKCCHLAPGNLCGRFFWRLPLFSCYVNTSYLTLYYYCYYNNTRKTVYIIYLLTFAPHVTIYDSRQATVMSFQKYTTVTLIIFYSQTPRISRTCLFMFNYFYPNIFTIWSHVNCRTRQIFLYIFHECDRKYYVCTRYSYLLFLFLISNEQFIFIEKYAVVVVIQSVQNVHFCHRLGLVPSRAYSVFLIWILCKGIRLWLSNHPATRQWIHPTLSPYMRLKIFYANSH